MANTEWVRHEDVKLHNVVFDVCAMCLQNAGGECHTPGCAFWMNDAPDPPLVSFLKRWAD